MSIDGMTVQRDGDRYTTTRISREAAVTVTVDAGQPREPVLATGLAFFDHMLEMLGWYADLTVDAAYEVRTYRLAHVVCEDTGLALGAALAQLLRDRIAGGVDSSGAADGIIDEASATARVSFEGRSGCRVVRGGAAAGERVEDMLCADLAEFFAGVAQGGRCTIQLDIDERCEDPHHAWEAAFRAFGRALRAALAPNPRRAGRTAGVKGTLD